MGSKMDLANVSYFFKLSLPREMKRKLASREKRLLGRQRIFLFKIMKKRSRREGEVLNPEHRGK